MHILLTDHLTCPRCGPEFGLILLAERMENRRVFEGWLGCANCREKYPIAGGFADLRAGRVEAPAGEGGSSPEEGDREEAFRLAALLGVTEGPGFVLVVGEAARLAPGIAGVVEGIEVVAVDPSLAGWPEVPGVSRLATGAQLPFFSGTMRAVALTGERAERLLEEGARVVSRLGRLVVQGAGRGVVERLARAGLEPLAAEGETVVAVRR
ncbi:MAG TPA: hypothetical protein VIL13_13985 [Longimicrobiales bacterium]